MALGKNKNNESKPIKLTDAQKKEQKTAGSDDILLSEEELLGTTPGSSGGAGSTGAATGTGQSSAKTKAAASKFHIPVIVKNRYPDLIPLIIETESMDDEEREYWFQILPIMTTDQVNKFRDILISEKDQLAKLDAEYEKELQKINDQHLFEWQEFEQKQAKDDLKKKERAEESQEQSVEESLLQKLDEL